MASSSVRRDFLKMAFKSKFRFNMHQCLLIALLILIIQDMSFGSDMSGVRAKKEKNSYPNHQAKGNASLLRNQANASIAAQSHPNVSAVDTGEQAKKPDQSKVSEKSRSENSNPDAQVGLIDHPNDDEQEHDSPSDQQPEEIAFRRFEENSVAAVPKMKVPSEEISSASNFMTYFILVVVVVIIAYLVVHNKKKLLAYIVEGRNTGRSRRQRATSGTEYKPLKNGEEASGCRSESA